MRARSKWSLVAVAICLASAMDSRAMVRGAAAEAGYEAVGSLVPVKGGIDESLCTATLIAPQWIATAQHCLEGGSEENPITYKASELAFQVGRDARKPVLKVRLKRWIAPPKSALTKGGTNDDGQLDTAFAELSQPITSVAGQPIRPIPLDLKAPFFEGGSELFEIVGFGERSAQGFGGGNGIRQKATYKVTTVTGNAFMKLFQSANGFARYLNAAHPGEVAALDHIIGGADLLIPSYMVHAWDPRGRDGGKYTGKPSGGWSTSCHGDSGGPMLRTVNGQKRVVGVISTGFNGAKNGCIELGSLISVYGPKVQAQIAANKIPTN